jgi:hypothetical protein
MFSKRLLLATAIVFAAAPMQAGAVVIVDGTTSGFYNAGLGDLSTDSVLGAQTDTATSFNLFPAANVSAGDPTIPPVASAPNLVGADPATVTALGSFLGNTTALGGNWSAAPQAIPSTWSVNDETAIVYTIDAGAGFSDLTVNIGVDNGVYVWFDGAYQFGAMAPGGASAFEYSVNVGPVSGGTHFLQILREDHGGATGWVIRADATLSTSTVAEPASLALLGLGLVALGFGAKRSIKA